MQFYLREAAIKRGGGEKGPYIKEKITPFLLPFKQAKGLSTAYRVFGENPNKLFVREKGPVSHEIEINAYAIFSTKNFVKMRHADKK